MKRVLLLGHAGFSGHYMTAYLQQVPGLSLFGADLNKTGIIQEYREDLMQSEAVNHIIGNIKPDMVINLAGLIRADDPGILYASNVLPVIHIIQSLIRHGLSGTSVLVISSAAVYGNAGVCPIAEENPVSPVNVYGTSKLAMEQILPVLDRENRFRIMIARTFNLIGPGLAESLSIPAFIRQLADIKKHRAVPVLKTGNLHTARDYIDIRDAVKAYWKILTEGKSGEVYNVGSGRSVSMQEILHTLIELSGMEVAVEKDVLRVRKDEIMQSQADIKKIKTLGWLPEIDLGQSLHDMVAYYQ